jgi:hypothetical protein
MHEWQLGRMAGQPAAAGPGSRATHPPDLPSTLLNGVHLDQPKAHAQHVHHNERRPAAGPRQRGLLDEGFRRVPSEFFAGSVRQCPNHEDAPHPETCSCRCPSAW